MPKEQRSKLDSKSTSCIFVGYEDAEFGYSYSHLKIFGCKAFVHMPKEQRSKLDSKSTSCIFVGYEDAEFGYKLWDPKEKKMIKS